MHAIDVFGLAAAVVIALLAQIVQPRSRVWWTGMIIAALIGLSAVGDILWNSWGSNWPTAAQPTVPKLRAEIAGTILGEAMISNKMTAGVIIIASMTNEGSIPTTVSDYRVAVTKDKNVYQGIILGCPKTFTVGPLPTAQRGKDTMQFYDVDALYNKTSVPLSQGDKVFGFLLVSFPTLADYTVLSGGFEVDFAYQDAFQNWHFDRAIPHPETLTRDFRSAMRVYPGMHTEFHMSK